MSVERSERENARMVLAVVATLAVMLGLLAAAGMWFLRRRRERAATALPAPESATPEPVPEPLPGSEPAEA